MPGPEASNGPASPLHPGRRAGGRRLAWVERVLRDQGMPDRELRVVMTSADRELIGRHLDLHRERLDEWLARQQRLVDEVGRILAGPRDLRVVCDDIDSVGRAVAR